MSMRCVATYAGRRIEGNTFRSNRKPVRIGDTQDHGIRVLPPEASQAPLPELHHIRNSRFDGNVLDIELRAGSNANDVDNQFAHTPEVRRFV